MKSFLRRAAGVAAGVGVGAVALLGGSGPAGAAVPLPLSGDAVSAICGQGAARPACINASVSGQIIGKSVSAAATLRPGDRSTGVVRVQIDHLSVMSVNQIVLRTGPVNQGSSNEVTAHASAQVPLGPECAVYRVGVVASMRMSDGSLQHTTFAGPYFMPSHSAACPSTVAADGNRADCFTAGGKDCSGQTVGIGYTKPTGSQNHGWAWAYARLSFDGSAYNRRNVARLSLDHTDLVQDGKVVSVSVLRGLTTGTLQPYSNQLLAVSKRLTFDACHVYQARMYYSVRYTDGRLAHGVYSTGTKRVC